MSATFAPDAERAEAVWALPRDRAEGLHLTVAYLADGWQHLGTVVSNGDGLLYPAGPEFLPACGHVPADGFHARYWTVDRQCAVCVCHERGLEMLRPALVATRRRGVASEGRCLGTNHRHYLTLGECDACGELIARSDKGALVAITRRSTENGEQLRPVCWAAHQCEPYRVAERTVAHVDEIASGALVKGQTVRVVKGRKVAKGTVGVIRWVGEDAFKPGAQRLGLAVEGQAKLVYIAEANVQPV